MKAKKQSQPSLLVPPALVPEPPLPTSPAPATDDHAYDLYIEHQKQAWSDCQSGSDEFDKSILTYSSAGLGVSLVFIKDIVPLAKAAGLMLLYASWTAFGVAILVTVFSFQLSVMAQENHLEHLRKYYLDRQPEYLNAPNKFTLWVGRFKWISGFCFVFAMAGTIVFSVWNLTEARQMSDKNNPARQQDEHFGRKPLGMTPVTPMPQTALPPQTAPNVSTPPTSNHPKTDK